jgi:succinyl-CoA synthetase alpha subunit
MVYISQGRVLIQGIAPALKLGYLQRMQAYGTNLVGAVGAGYGGQTQGGLPVFDLVESAVEALGPVYTSVIFVPPYAVLDAALEAIAAGIQQIVLIGEGVPPLDMVQLMTHADAHDTLILGPNSPGLIIPGQTLLGIHPTHCYTPGPVGIVSRSGSLTYEVARSLTQAGLGQSMSISIGDDAIVGSAFGPWLQILEDDEATQAIVLVGEAGGDSEEQAARHIQEFINKPVIAYVAGRSVPVQRRTGHASTLLKSHILGLSPEVGSISSKLSALAAAEVALAQRLSQIPDLVRRVLQPSPTAVAS